MEKQINLDELKKSVFTEYPDCVNVHQLQKMLGIARSKSYDLVRTGEIKSIQVGRDYKISKLNVIAYLYGEKQI